MFSAVFGLLTLSSHAIAQQKTATACRDEWRANKAANQANGVTEKAYVAQCRGGAAPAQTTAAPAAPPAPAPTAAPPRDKRLPGLAETSGGPTRPLTRPTASRKRPMSLNAAVARPPLQTTAAPAAHRHLLPQQHPQPDKRLPGHAATNGGPTRPPTRPTA